MDLDVQTLRMERELKTYGASLHMVTLLGAACCAPGRRCARCMLCGLDPGLQTWHISCWSASSGSLGLRLWADSRAWDFVTLLASCKDRALVPMQGKFNGLEAVAATVSGKETVAGGATVIGSKALPSKWLKKSNFSCRGPE